MTIRQVFPFKNTWSYLFLIVMSLFVVLPLLIVVSQSLMTNQAVNRWPPQIIPFNPTLDNYHTVLTQQDLQLGLWLRNSLLAATCYTAAVLVICSPAAYAFARLKFPGNNIL
ncbi:MAG TPA: hypothetical protein VHL11_00140, partial [Phototrophicaceae bacterium]|nr:hypothetical protein [Phototrophicaceae bacterium]